MAVTPPRTTVGRHHGPVILVVAMSGSIHTARWLNMLQGHGLRIVLLPIFHEPPVAEIDGKLVRTAADVAALTDQDIGVFDLNSVASSEVDRLDRQMGYSPWSAPIISMIILARPAHLYAAIRLVQPALLHSMEVQYAGYLCAATKRMMGGDFPFWLLGNWGSDIFLYRKIPEHQPRLAEIAQTIDAYIAECQRDVGIVRELGFRGPVLPPVPASGGMAFDHLPNLQSLPKPSTRREILIKGYHGWSGRGLHILNALHLAAPALQHFRIRITLAGEQVTAAAARMAEWDGLEIVCEPFLDDHSAALQRLSTARMVIGLGISDGISTTLLEAMTMGTLPIQGSGSCGCEWIKPGHTGFIVSPHDVQGLKDAIIRVATDDALVDEAAALNRRVVEERWNAAVNGAVVADAYRTLIATAAGQSATTPGWSGMNEGV